MEWPTYLYYIVQHVLYYVVYYTSTILYYPLYICAYTLYVQLRREVPCPGQEKETVIAG